MKSCFQSSDKQGESGGNRGKGGDRFAEEGEAHQVHLHHLPSPKPTSSKLSHLNPPNISNSWLTLIHLRKLECLLAGNSAQLIIVRSLTEGATANAHVDRGGGVDRGRWQFTLGRVSSYSIFSALPLPLLAPIFLSTALRSCSTTCELENRKILFWWSSGLTKAGKFLIWLITVLTVETPVGSWGGWRALNLWDFCFSYLSKVLNIGFRLHRRSDKSEWCVFQSRKVQALRIKEIPCSYK